MRPLREALAGVGVLVLFGAVIGVIYGHRSGMVPDPRRSTYLAGPYGARGFAEGAERLGVRVNRWRRRLPGLDSTIAAPGTLFAELAPSFPLDAGDADALLAFFARGGSLLLAGPAGGPAFRCFGYTIRRLDSDSVRAMAPGTAPGARAPFVRQVLAHTTDSVYADSSAAADTGPFRCAVTPPVAAETLLVTPRGGVVALRLRYVGEAWVILVSDGGLFTNRALRETEAGPFALGLVAPRYPRLLVDEFHHGFGAEGSLFTVLTSWSRHSPWGWLLWQLAAVGVLVLLADAVRFGAPRSVIGRQRRSPIEHVRALATALAASRGHDVAVELQIQGLRRRLGRGTRSAATPGARREEAARWLRLLAEGVRSQRAREAVRTLQELIARPQPAAGVLRAASAVEDVWEELRP